MAEISPLRRRMIEDMTVRNLSPATQQSYLSAAPAAARPAAPRAIGGPRQPLAFGTMSVATRVVGDARPKRSGDRPKYR